MDRVFDLLALADCPLSLVTGRERDRQTCMNKN